MRDIDPAEMAANAAKYQDLDGEPWNGLFVRSQVQVTFDSRQATGHRMTPYEVAEAFGETALAKIVEDGTFPIVKSPHEPARTLKQQRNTLGLTVDEVARESGIPEPAVVTAETEGILNPVRTVERIAQQLGLDEHRIGLMEQLGDASELGARLRKRLDRRGRTAKRSAKDQTQVLTGLNAATVLRLAEAAWVIAKQVELEHLLALEPRSNSRSRPRAEPLYSGPAWRQGYELARRTRDMLGLDQHQPISSLRALLDEQQGIPLHSITMSRHVAGATLANGQQRGIVVNTVGLNENVWVRRMTAAHELCHFLWDSEANLDRLRVDTYDELERDSHEARFDAVEQRANAFAVEFLAPRQAISPQVKSLETREQALSLITQTYGISVTAAAAHLDNAPHGNSALYGEVRVSLQPSDEWKAAENFGLDYFPLRSCPDARRGRFAQLVARAVELGRMTPESGALLLAVSPEEFEAGLEGLLELDPQRPNRPRSRLGEN
jgi:Zn-dependent peptidase ImmA (M78 family)